MHEDFIFYYYNYISNDSIFMKTNNLRYQPEIWEMYEKLVLIRYLYYEARKILSSYNTI